MIRVVLDTNVIVSALLSSDGVPAAILDLALQGKVRAAVSTPTLSELDSVLRRPKFQFEPRKIGSFLALLRSRARRVTPRVKLDICGKDPSDNRFLECAEAAHAEFLVTGNKSHFPSRHRKTAIISPAEFWEIYLLRAGISA